MRIAHLIMAHRAPAQLVRQLRGLHHPQADCFIHLDTKADLSVFSFLGTLPQVQFVRRRFAINWGGFGFTEALLASLRELLAHPARYEFINLLSGQDYPLRPAEELHAYLAAHPGRSFVEAEPMGSPWWQANRSRLERYHLTDAPALPGRYAVQRALNAVLPRRQFPLGGYVVYGGNMSCWYTLSRTAAEYLVNFFTLHPELHRFGRLSWGSDEFLVATVLYNSPLRETLLNNSLRYIDWSQGGAHPKLLTTADLPALLASGRFWGRKFDLDTDTAVLDELDARHQNRLQTAARPGLPVD
ncbi:beta-1,6-N-acetylglucosaminyltransferase [Hymenobacter canadensis]|uniref:Peptide O-xylosyltransferase n=1 Tax=Hymenobacter canadensis TaxID=2999067 RepID=A0ABY7LUA8_9BACT|nr:beta-1,6-N-acetylglucosaminyltransferase [Hymenobacter canadensis]WBA43081.1 glycosyl transferase [Hymenobacter canadensis]